MRLERLPGWVIDNETSVREEVAPYLHMTMAQRWQATQRCCEAAAAMLRFNREPESALSHRDPIPQSTLTALARLRSGTAT